MLNAKKKFGIGLTLAGMALLLLAFLSIPFAWEMRIRWLLLGGGILLVWADVLARCVLSGGQELPVGVVTALLAVLGIVYFFVTERILRRHLNLE